MQNAGVAAHASRAGRRHPAPSPSTVDGEPNATVAESPYRTATIKSRGKRSSTLPS
jgi:hypothetical protein